MQLFSEPPNLELSSPEIPIAAVGAGAGGVVVVLIVVILVAIVLIRYTYSHIKCLISTQKNYQIYNIFKFINYVGQCQ